MNSKLLDSISRKLQPNEVLIDIFPVAYLRGDKRKEDTLAITSQSFHFLFNNSLKKTIAVRDIRVVTLSTFSQELVLHCQEEDIRLESLQTVKLLQNLLRIRQKVINDPSPMPVMLQKEKSLARFVSQDTKRSRFWSGLFGRKEPQQSKWRWSERHSYCELEVTQRNFALQIGRKMYASNYVNVELLYLSGALGFIFNELDYAKEQVDQDEYILTNSSTGDRLKLRKVVKGDEQEGRKLRRYLQGFRWEDFKQQIYYAVETNRHFEIVTPLEKGQRSIEAFLEEDRFISQIDLVSIFYKLMAFAQSCSLVLHSLSPAQILVSDNILIDSFFCILPHNANPHYLAPEQLHTSYPSSIQLINFWKIGMILYEIAFASIPFPIEYLAHTVLTQGKFTLRFPPDAKRSASFKNFLGEILKLEPGKRGGGADWKTRIFDHFWLRESMK